ncbi:MAG: hypothetical protein AAGI10_05075 [Pseudomonadota bacterium]
MKSFKTRLTTLIGIIGFVILAPLVAFFGLAVLGFVFGASLIAVGTFAAVAKGSEDTVVSHEI